VTGNEVPSGAGKQGPKSANPFLSLLRGRSRRPLIIAHRGDSFHAPENTLVAAERACDAGADAWEFDVHLTRDGVSVVVHDESLLRTTDVARRFSGDPREADGFPVSSFDFDEIKSLNAGSWFLEPGQMPRSAFAFGTLGRLTRDDLALFRSGEVRVPSLREALELTARLGWLANVELKSFPNPQPALLNAVLAEIEALGVLDRVLVSSFNHRDLARARSLAPGLAIGVLADLPLHRPDLYVVERLQADTYHPSAAVLGAEGEGYRSRPHSRGLATDELDGLRQAGIPVLVYTVNDTNPEGLAVHLVEAGVEAIFSDDPSGMKSLFHG
jgi:glycerophosphoryl diester phosphodiesterase